MTERKAGTSSIVAIGADHAGFALKEDLRKTLGEQGYTLRDFGTFSVDSVDYPDIAATVAEEVSAGHFEQAILVCGTGAGMAIAANKVAGVRAAGCSEPYTASMSRRHNNANVLCLGARVVGTGSRSISR